MMRAMRTAVTCSLVLGLIGCGFEIRAGGTGGPDGGREDGGGTVADACTSFASYLDTCALPAGAPLELDGTFTLDTDTGTLTSVNGSAVPVITTATVATTPGNVEVLALVVTDLQLRANARLRGEGTRPLVVVARGEIHLEDGSAISVSVGGAGARTTCEGGATAGADDGGGGGGGGGGGFGGEGGAGGEGDSDNGRSAGGMAGAADAPSMVLRGGCPGGSGGRGQSGELGGVGGLAGGVAYVVSAVGIEVGVDAGVAAGGEGGRGGGHHTGFYGDAGGGGGGSGGMIVVEAPHIRGGVLAANGGAGGEGSGNRDSGRAGGDGRFDAMPALPAASNSATGAEGGAGGAGTMPTGAAPANVNQGGGGGGGGGVGVIRVVSPDAVITIVSPPAS